MTLLRFDKNRDLKKNCDHHTIFKIKTEPTFLTSLSFSLCSSFSQGASASPKTDDNLFLWQACIFGPPDTAWDGGVFNLTLIFTDNYPASPPIVKFDTPIFHPNGLIFFLFKISST